MSWLRTHLDVQAARGVDVVFVPSRDETLRHFAVLIEKDMTGLDADLAHSPLVAHYHSPYSTLTVTARYGDDSAPAEISWRWEPANPSAEPATGLVAPAPDSPLTGLARHASVLLTRTRFVHLSAERGATGLLVRGARFTGGDSYDYLELDGAD